MPMHGVLGSRKIGGQNNQELAAWWEKSREQGNSSREQGAEEKV